MNRIDWRDHVEISSDIHHGDPRIKGTRIPVATIVGSLADGMTVVEIVDAYPQITPSDVQAALAYAAEMIQNDVLLPF